VRAQPLRSARTAALLLDGAEHVRHAPRVVTGPRHDLRAEQVGLAFVFTAVLQEIRAEPEVGALSDDVAGGAADDGAENLAGDSADLEFLRLGRLRGPVAERDVRDLVRHDAGDLAFLLRRFNHAAMEEHRPAGQRERVDLGLVDDLEAVAEFGVLKLTRNRLDEVASDPLHVAVGA
jgi:hypothetical protein